VNTSGVLIVGGYGVVGQRIAAELAPEYPGHVVIAGRNETRAHEVANMIGHGARGRKIDITTSTSIADALRGIEVVVSCIDQPNRKLLWAAIERGLRYTDITPHLTELGRGSRLYEIEAASIKSGAKIVLGTGIVPGISNVIVRSLVDKLGGADEIETALLLDARDTKGPASLDYFLQELSMPFDVWIQGRDVPTGAFTNPKLVEFPQPIGTQLAYLFPFSDQVLYPRTLGVKTVTTRLAISPRWLARLLAAVVRMGLTHLVATETFRRLVAKRPRTHDQANGAQFALRVDVMRGTRSLRATLVGKGQADAAAAGAAGVARLLIENEIKSGVWMPEQIVPPGPFLSRLSATGFKMNFDGYTP
jgi:saccharopine dehydrogenase-like NADP-dependent oxidoreductase